MSADLSTVYDGLNALGRVPWRINRRVLAVAQRCWDENIPLGDVRFLSASSLICAGTVLTPLMFHFRFPHELTSSYRRSPYRQRASRFSLRKTVPNTSSP
jgi:hypothetical protein